MCAHRDEVLLLRGRGHVQHRQLCHTSRKSDGRVSAGAAAGAAGGSCGGQPRGRPGARGPISSGAGESCAADSCSPGGIRAVAVEAEEAWTGKSGPC